MKVLISPNAMKGSIDATLFARAIAQGLENEGFFDNIILPIADGGDGSAQIIANSLNARYIQFEVNDPLSRKVDSGFYLSSNQIAIIEMASASGLKLLQSSEYDALNASSYGTGQLVKAAVKHGAKSILLCVGGSATSDAGMGAMMALGCKFFSGSNEIILGSGAIMGTVESVDYSEMRRLLSHTEITIVVDVSNPLLGENGTVNIFSQQKGANKEQRKALNKNMAFFAQTIFQTTGIDVSEMPGGGAAGGIAAGLHAFTGAKIVSGTEFILELTGFKKLARECDAIITGEGRLDQQTFFGKALYGVVKIGMEIDKPIFVICGENQLNSNKPFNEVYELVDSNTTVNDAMANAYDMIVKRTTTLAMKWKENGKIAE
jgi:glycerate 2-kinase